MAWAVPEELAHARDAVVLEVKEAFADVTRIDGVSWSEADVIDDYGSMEERLRARARDQESSWMDLVEDPVWNNGGMSEWAFLDAIGFRYYLPPAMVRCLMTGDDQGIEYHLRLPTFFFRRHTLKTWSLFDARQRSCIAHFLQTMVAIENSQYGPSAGKGWRDALESYWGDFA